MTPEEIRYKIVYEIIVDAYDDYEVAMGWYYFFQDELKFPFEAEIEIKKRDGTKSLTQVDVLEMSSEESDFKDPEIELQVSPKNSDQIMEVKLSKLKNVKGNEAVLEAIEIWNFWKSNF